MDKSGLQNWLHESYEKWEAFLDQFGTARMDEPGVAGHWSMKDIIVHLTGWDQYVVAHVQAARRGEPEPPPPWPADLQNDDEINAWLYERNHGRSVDEIRGHAGAVPADLHHHGRSTCRHPCRDDPHARWASVPPSVDRRQTLAHL